MMLLVGLAEMIVWFVISLYLVKFCFKIAAKMGLIDDALARPILRNSILILVASLLVLPDILFHYYQKATMPFVCDSKGGYQPYNPVKVTSILNWDDAFDYLVLPNVDFVEWERRATRPNKYRQWEGRFQTGKYRFSFYPKGSEQCIDLKYLHPEIDENIEQLKQRYKDNGYPTKVTIGQCVGVEKIDEITALYQVNGKFERGGEIKEIEDSGFGYSVESSSVQLVNRRSGEIVSSFKYLHTASPMPFFSLFSPNTLLAKGCPSDKELLEARLITNGVKNASRTLAIEYGFFDFSDE